MPVHKTIEYIFSATSTASYFIGYSSINNIAQGPVGFYTGAGLPANSVATAPVCKFYMCCTSACTCIMP